MDASYESSDKHECKAIGVCFLGLLLVPITMGVVFLNESDEVVNHATSQVVTPATVVEGCNPSPQTDGKLVFAACNVTAPDLASNLPEQLRHFLPSYNGSSLQWSTSILQYTEDSHKDCRKDNHGDKTCITTYSCKLGWSSGPVDSGNFQCPEVKRGINRFHGLPTSFTPTQSVQAPEYSVKMVSPTVSAGPLSSESLGLNRDLMHQLPSEDLGPKLQRAGIGLGYGRSGGILSAYMLSVSSSGYLTTGNQLGDLKISLHGQSAGQATVAAKQLPCLVPGLPSQLLVAWPPQTFGWFGKQTKPLEKLLPGILNVDEFKKLWEKQTSRQAWIIRVATFVLMVVGFEMIVQPLSVSTDLLRVLNHCTCCCGSLLEDLEQCMIHTIAFFCAVIAWLFTFAVAWIVVRPGLGIFMFVLDIGVILVAVILSPKMKSARSVDACRTQQLVLLKLS